MTGSWDVEQFIQVYMHSKSWGEVRDRLGLRTEQAVVHRARWLRSKGVALPQMNDMNRQVANCGRDPIELDLDKLNALVEEEWEKRTLS